MPLPILVSRNGELVSPDQAHVSVFSPVLYGSFGVYESLQVVHGRPFALEPHLERLTHSAAQIDLPLPWDHATFGQWIADVLQANQATECVLRIFALGSENGGTTTTFLWPQPCPVYPATFYTEGASAITFEGQRALPTAKTINTLVSFLAQRKARAAGAHEGLLYHEGHLTEGASSNLYAVVDGLILTAPDEQVLSGVARDIVLALAQKHGIGLRETPLALADLSRWSECFITSTSRHVMPVTIIDGRPVGDGRVGPHTRRLMGLFEGYFAQASGA